MPVLPVAGDVSARRLPTWLRRRWSLLAVSAVFVASAFAQARGLLVADTKTDLVVDPGAFLQRSLDLWDPSASFGRIQNQAVGYWFPMGPFFWLGEVLGVPPWVTQRLWWSVVLVVALWGFVKLAEAFDVGTPGSRLIGAVAFATGPAVLIELGSRSPNVLPIALLPFALLPLVYGSRGGSARRAACASAVVVLAMGGVNATVTAAALVVPVLFLLSRRPGPRRRSLTAWWIGSVAAVTLWWWGPLLLQQRYSFDILAFTEDAAATTRYMSLTETVRGVGFWLVQLRDAGVPWLPSGVQLGGGAAVLGTTLVVAAGLGGLADRRLPERAFLVLSLAAGVATMGAGYAGELGGPLSSQVQDLLDGPLAVIRNVHKLAPLVALPLALGAVHVLGLAFRRLDRPPPGASSRAAVTVLATTAIVLVLLAAGGPLTTRDLAPVGSFEEIPSYWGETAAWLEDETGGDRVLVVPGTPFPRYVWGAPTDEPLQALYDGPWAVRDIIPFGGVRSTRLLDGYEEVFHDGRTAAGFTESLARSGIGWVVVRNDLDPFRTAAPDPVFVTQAMEDAGLVRVAGFGPVLEATSGRERLTPTLAPGRTVQAVEVYRVQGSADRAVAYDLDTALTVVGNTETVQALGDQGLLGERAVLLAQDDPELAADTARWVVTDDFRLRDVDFGRVHGADSYTLQPGEDAPRDSLGGDSTAREPVDRLLVGDEESRSEADLAGVTTVEASSYYTGFDRRPGYQPQAALDGDPSTAWHVAGLREPVGEWWRVRFDEPRSPSSVEIVLPETAPDAGHISDVRVTTDVGSVEGSFSAPGDRLLLDLPPGPTTQVQVTIEGAFETGAGLLPLGIAEISLDGLAPVDRVVVTPDVNLTEPVAVALTREPSDPFDAVSAPEDRTLDRRVGLPSSSSYELDGTAVAVPGDDLTELVRTVEVGPTGAPAAKATSTRQDLPAFAPGMAVDGDPATAWVADVTDPSPAIELRWDDERPVDGLRLAFPPAPALVPVAVTVTTDAGTETVPVGPDGSVTLDGGPTDRLEIALDVEDRASGIVGLGEVEVEPVAPADASDRLTEDAADVAVEVPCGSGPDVVIDGVTVPTRLSGTLEDLRRLRPVAMAGCERVDLEAGAHRITGPVTGAFQAESIALDPPPPLPPGRTRETEVTQWDGEDREVRVGPGGSRALLTVSENRNDGWVATLDGEELAPATVDGWRQAWVVPPGDGGVVHLTYEPGVLYDRMLLAGAVLALAVVIAALVPARPGEGAAAAPARRVSEGLIIGAATLAVALAAGVVAVLVPVVWLAVRRPRARMVIAAGAFAAMGVVMVIDHGSPGAEFSAVGQILTGLAVAAALVGPAVSPIRRPDRESDGS